MNVKSLFNILGALSTILGLTMVIPLLISLGSEQHDFQAFIKSSIICISLGLPCWFLPKTINLLQIVMGLLL